MLVEAREAEFRLAEAEVAKTKRQIDVGVELGVHDWNHRACPLTQPQSLASGSRTNRFMMQV
jgi:hypothetical protein